MDRPDIERLIDFIRVGFNHVGGITPGLKIAVWQKRSRANRLARPGNIVLSTMQPGHVDLTYRISAFRKM